MKRFALQAGATWEQIQNVFADDIKRAGRWSPLGKLTRMQESRWLGRQVCLPMQAGRRRNLYRH
jgi:hypothetical protein